jgi:hypothetical protein
MGVGLYLKGQVATEGKLRRAEAEAWLKEVARWLPGAAGECWLGCRQGRRQEKWPALFVRLHPGAEEVELWLTASGRLTASATTSPVGPGYHVFVCELLRQLGARFGVTWAGPDPEGGGDETGYFHSGDLSAVEDEFLTWIHTLAEQVSGLLGQMSAVRIAMPLECELEVEGAAVTPLGPRGTDWFRAVADDPRRAVDFFAWWPAGLGAEFYLGRALTRMWTEIRWRPPLEDDDEEEDLLIGVLRDLEKAYLLSPDLDYPWRAWDELFGHLVAAFGDTEILESAKEDMREVVARRAAQAPDGPRIGYRRLPVTVSLGGGWKITVPGAFAESWDEDGIWVGWDGRRTVRCKTYALRSADGGLPAAEDLLDMSVRHWDTEGCEPLPDHERGPVRGRAIWGPHDEDGRSMWKLNAFSATAGQVALCNCYFDDPADRDWAVATWHSLTHPGPKTEEE